MSSRTTKSTKKRSSSPNSRQTSNPQNGENLDLREQAGVVRDDMRDLARAAGDAAVQQLDPIQEYVRDKPLKSMLIAAGVGAVFGMVFLRR